VIKLRNFTALYLKHVVRNFILPFLKQNSQQDAPQRLETTILQQMKTTTEVQLEPASAVFVT